MNLKNENLKHYDENQSLGSGLKKTYLKEITRFFRKSLENNLWNVERCKPEINNDSFCFCKDF